MRRASLALALVGLMAPGTGDVLRAQGTEGLGDPVAVYGEPLSFLQTVREMSDGRVLLADPLEQRLFFLDMATGMSQPVGREGGGPMEYRQPDSVWPFGGDTSLMVDLGNSRLTEVSGDGTFGDTYPLAIWPAGDGPGVSPIMLLPQGVDEQGNVYVTARQPLRPGDDPPDSAFVVRVNLASATADTIGSVKTPDLVVSRQGGGNVSMEQIPLSAADAWGVAPDGRVVIARAGDYHVEWHALDGSTVRGAPVGFDPVRIGTAEKEAWASEASGAGIRIGISVDGSGARSMSMSRGGGGGDGPDLSRYQWPDRMAPFAGGRINVDSRGQAWVRRNTPAGDPAVYDVFGPDGNRVGSVTMDAGQRVVGFGEGTVYVTHRDEYDLVYLEKYRLPDL